MENQRISSENYVSAWNLGGLVVTQMALKAAIELNVFNIIANSGPGAHLTSKEIVSQISTENPNVAAANLKRILRVLSVHSLLSVQRPSSSGKTMQEETYGLTKETLWLVPNEDGVSLAPFILLSSEMDIVKSLSMLKDTVLEPGCLPFNKAFGMSIYEYMSEKPDLSQLFNKGVGQSSILDFEEVLKVYKGFEEVEELMDVGGGDGMTISKVVSRYPHIHGINFDLPNVIAQGTAKYQTAGVKYVGGDVFQFIPNAQSIMLKWVLHNWNDDLCKKILKRCWEALPKTGKVIVVEFAIPEILEKTEEVKKIVALDVVMMATPGGRERTIAEFDDLSKATGFVETKIFSISNGCYVLEFHKVETY